MTTRQERRHAAELLRKARRASGEVAAEAVAWARCAAPESRAALALEITLALRAGDQHHADATIAQGLLLRPEDPRLLAFHARRLFDRGMKDQARRAIERAVAARPGHAATRLLAGEIAVECGNLDRALDHFDAATDAIGPSMRRAAQTALFDLHLHQGRVDDAARTLRLFQSPPALLEARLLRAQRSIPEAIRVLEAALGASATQAERDLALTELIDLCDCAHDDERALQHVERTSAAAPRATLRAAAVFLRMGRFVEAKACALRVRSHGELGGEAAAVAELAGMAIGGAEKQDPDEGPLFVRRAPQPPLMASLWRRALLGRLLNEIRAGSEGRADSPLTELLHWAHGVFARADKDDEAAAHQRTVCEAAIAARAG